MAAVRLQQAVLLTDSPVPSGGDDGRPVTTGGAAAGCGGSDGAESTQTAALARAHHARYVSCPLYFAAIQLLLSVSYYRFQPRGDLFFDEIF